MTPEERRAFGKKVQRARKDLGYKTAGRWRDAIASVMGDETRSTKTLLALERGDHVHEDTVLLVQRALERLGAAVTGSQDVAVSYEAPVVQVDGDVAIRTDPAVRQMLECIAGDPHLDSSQKGAIRAHYLGLIKYQVLMRQAEDTKKAKETRPPPSSKRTAPRGRKTGAKTSPTPAGTKT